MMALGYVIRAEPYNLAKLPPTLMNAYLGDETLRCCSRRTSMCTSRSATIRLPTSSPSRRVVTFPFGLAGGASVPARTVAELVALVKANPERANYGSPAPDTLPHFLVFGSGKVSGSTCVTSFTALLPGRSKYSSPGTFPSSSTRPTNRSSCTRTDESAC